MVRYVIKITKLTRITVLFDNVLVALYGVLFESDEEAAFSNYRLWESLGFIFAYVLQNTVCVYTKLWVVIGVLACGMAGYLIIEVIECKKRPSN